MLQMETELKLKNSGAVGCVLALEEDMLLTLKRFMEGEKNKRSRKHILNEIRFFFFRHKEKT